jgi:hypothetical protein
MKSFNFIALILLIVFSTFASDDPNLLSVSETVPADCAFASVEAAYKQSKAVFTGKVLNVEVVDGNKVYEFRVEKYWKGIKDRKIKIMAMTNMRYEPNYQGGKTYLIYAYADDKGGLRVGKCSRGSALEFAKEDLKILGKGKKMR